MNGITAYALSQSYTDSSIAGAGAIKGAPCTIDSITDIEGGHRITFKWELDDGTVQTESMDVMNGEKGSPGPKGDPGDAGFAPQVEVEKSTDNEYILRIQDVDSNYDTPNLKGSGAVSSSYDEENENVHIW